MNILILALLTVPSLCETVPLTQCGAHEYECWAGPCIDKVFRCDGTWDCPTGDDEAGCTSVATPSTTDYYTAYLAQFDAGRFCASGYLCADRSTCIPNDWRCDGARDCNDGSDEAHCEKMGDEEFALLVEKMEQHLMERMNPTTELPTAPCAEEEFRCMGGKCLNASLTCDGNHDCPLGDDESERCKECEMVKKCSHFCTDSINGSTCSCPAGMILSSDGKTCEGVDECMQGGHNCSQYCHDKVDGYECSCLSGYELAGDGHTCLKRVDHGDLMIVFTLHTNLPNAYFSADFASRLSSKIAETFKKPERYVIVHLIGEQMISFGGDATAPAGLASIKSQENLDVGTASKIVELSVGIEKKRLLIEFVSSGATVINGRAFL